jgi:DNA-binding transcriptional ArsR family regulator
MFDARPMDEMVERAPGAAAFLKGLANPQRLLILCRLTRGEACVSDLIEATGIAPTSMSQHLNKLKDEGIVAMRRDHRTLFYRIDHPATLAVMEALYAHFCKGPNP